MSENTPETPTDDLVADDTVESTAEAGLTDERDGTPAGESVIEDSIASQENTDAEQ